MKKLLSILLALTACLSLCACGGGSPKTLPTTELVLGAENKVDNYGDFSLFKITTAKKITASLDDGIYYENDTAGETFVDIILDWTNTSTNTISSSDLLVAGAISANGTQYTRCLYAVETNNAKYLSQYENIAPLSTVRIHCAISVPENETDLTLVLNIKGNRFSYAYSVGDVASTAKPIQVGDTVEEEDFATLVFNGMEYTDDLLPPDTSSAYNHYAIDSTSNTYLVAKFDITNYMATDWDCNSFVGIKAVYMDKYTYDGFVVVEDEDAQGFDSYEDIAPLTTRHFYYLIEVPKTVITNPVTLTLSFNGQEYTYTGQ